jgi:hypothetical protein
MNWVSGLLAAGGAVVGGIGGAYLAKSLKKQGSKGEYGLVGAAVGALVGASIPTGTAQAGTTNIVNK